MNFCLHEVNEYDLNRLDEIGAAYSTFGNLDNALKNFGLRNCHEVTTWKI